MKLLVFLDNLIDKIESLFIIIAVIMMVILSFLQVILRNLFSFGIPGTEELLRHLVFWIGLIGASLLTKEGRHIKIDILARALPGRIENIRGIVVNLVSAIIAGILLKTTFTFIGTEREFNESGTLFLFRVPVWVLQIVIPVTFSLMAFRYTLKVIEKLREYF